MEEERLLPLQHGQQQHGGPREVETPQDLPRELLALEEILLFQESVLDFVSVAINRREN